MKENLMLYGLPYGSGFNGGETLFEFGGSGAALGRRF